MSKHERTARITEIKLMGDDRFVTAEDGSYSGGDRILVVFPHPTGPGLFVKQGLRITIEVDAPQ